MLSSRYYISNSDSEDSATRGRGGAGRGCIRVHSRLAVQTPERASFCLQVAVTVVTLFFCAASALSLAAYPGAQPRITVEPSVRDALAPDEPERAGVGGSVCAAAFSGFWSQYSGITAQCTHKEDNDEVSADRTEGALSHTVIIHVRATAR